MNKQKLLLPGACLLLAGGILLLTNARTEGLPMYQEKLHPAIEETSPEESTSPAEERPADSSVEASASSEMQPNDTELSESAELTAQPEEPAMLPGESHNLSALEQREVFAEGFYAEPLSEELIDFMKGGSIPVSETGEPETPGVDLADLRYLHIMYINFQGNAVSGELICHNSVANDFLEIFEVLYDNAYQLERVELIEAYGGDDNASMAANNTSCFNYRVVENTTSLSNHAYGAAIDINPFYNPYIAYTTGEKRITPEGSEIYEDRDADFPHKIDADDLCYQLFIEHGFEWGGVWKSSKDYQHFQKPLK